MRVISVIARVFLSEYTQSDPMCKNLNIQNPIQFARFHQADSNSDFETSEAQQFHYKKTHMPLVFATLKLKKKTFEDSII